MKKHIPRAYDCFANDTRVRLLECLRTPHSVSELLSQCTLSQSALSQHLKILKDAGLVTCTRDGVRQVYRVANAKVSHVARAVRTLADTFSHS